ncbi:MAG: acyl-CoA dehydrogenase [Planctomycetes bacterium]|nr:acyl-CoA dehydrogenase [Planctomycetota bacterium]
MIDELRARARVLGEEHAGAFEGLDEEAAARQALAFLASAGLTAWAVPARHGGSSTGSLSSDDVVSVRALCCLRDELAYHHGMLDLMLVMQGLGSCAVTLGGSPELCADVLPGVACGEDIAALALTEPEAGSSLGDVATRAERTDSGWVLNGKKTLITNCGLARFYTVLARTAGKVGDTKGLSMFFVPADAWGVDVARFEVLSPHPIGDVIFKDCKIPGSFLLGAEGEGLDLALGTLSRFRTSVAAAANGFARRALDESRRHLSARRQFGKPLASNQALRFDLAEMDTRLRAAQLLVDEAATAVDAGETATAEVARAKLFATESAGWICDRAVQHFGGLGVKRGVVVERLYRDVRALRIYEGTSEIQKLILAREILG